MSIVKPNSPEKIQGIIESFKRTRSLVETGKEFNLTRERIRQIIDKHAPEIKSVKGSLLKHFTKSFGLPCRKCGKKMGIEIKAYGGGYCIECRFYFDNPNYVPKIKWSECIACKKTFNKVIRPTLGGLCKGCYDRAIYQTSAKRRESVARTNKKWHDTKKLTDPDYFRRRYRLRKRVTK